ncbi:hypothetical protein [Solibacillus isronensis]|uniref:hypothetical protein n=1 Tax=Solibacillus isronensis TaxID=412383 RepID=UPI00204049D6|nr:hypothetical protein [Solibacillus isronensis]MCM3722956.1 hypothetical protein [Solibacillus isronensis]
MKKGLLVLLSFIIVFPLFLGFFADDVEAKKTYVKGYYRKDGTYVKSHYRNSGGSSSSSSSSSSSYNSNYYFNNNNSTSKYSTKNIVNLYKGHNLIGYEQINELVYVKGYYRKDGTYVRPHFKTSPNKFIRDNFSFLGLSTLLPLEEKYTSYKYDSNDTIASTEHYLYTSTIDSNITSYRLKYLKDYAVSLNNNTPKYTKELYGEFFYEIAVGYDSNIAKALIKFDLIGILDFEMYLYQILTSMGIKDLSYSQKNYLEEYATLLNTQATKNDLIEAGKVFYNSIGLEEEEIIEQIELDILQNFTLI